MAIKTIKHKDLTWTNIEHADEEALAYLKEKHNFHHLDIEDVKSENQTPKIDTYKNYLFVILHAPHWQGNTKRIVPLKVDFFIGENFLITIQNSKVKEISNFFYKCVKNRKTKKECMNNTSGFLFYHILEELFYTSRSTLNNIGKEISRVENNIFVDEEHAHVIKELAIHRRNVLNFIRIIDPQRYIIANLAHMRKTFLDENTSIYFDNVVDYLNKLCAILDTYKDTVSGLHVTVESLMMQRTNKVIGTLTAISAGLFPLTLLSGIYGMNISGLPFAREPIFVWIMFGILSLIIIIIIFLLKKKQWL